MSTSTPRLLFLALVVLVLVALPAGAHAADSAPASLEELGKALDDLAVRIGVLIQEAGKDPDERKIETYQSYDLAQLRLKRRDVRVSDLVEFMLDPEKNFNVRQRAFKAISEGTFRGDPDLSKTEKKGRQSKRAYFSEKYLAKNLDHDDARSRKMCFELLDKWWRVRDVKEIVNYNLNDSKTWRKAIRAWSKYLDRQ